MKEDKLVEIIKLIDKYADEFNKKDTVLVTAVLVNLKIEIEALNKLK